MKIMIAYAQTNVKLALETCVSLRWLTYAC
jgi:hypothetical protein